MEERMGEGVDEERGSKSGRKKEVRTDEWEEEA